MKARHEFLTDEEWLSYLKTYFSAMAMQGMYSNNELVKQWNSQAIIEFYAVKAADSLINALNQTP